jgi:hypothetical protein
MKFKMADTTGLNLTLDPMGKMFQNASSLNKGNNKITELRTTLDPMGKMFQNASSLKPLG